MSKKKWLTVGMLLIVLALSITCNSSSDKETARLVRYGEELARIHCSGCHSFPNAEILPTEYWGNLLPIMGFFLGAGKEKFGFTDYLNPVAKNRLSHSGLFPESPTISVDKWIAINKYYRIKSPKTLRVKKTPKLDMALKQFDVEILPWKSAPRGLTYLNFDEGRFQLGFYDETESYYLQVDNKGNELEKTQLASPLVDISKKNSRELFLLIGELKNIDEPAGEIVVKTNSLQPLIIALERPINFEVEDFDNDGIDEILVAEFGKFLGGINLYTQKDKINKLNLHNGSGAVKTIVKDVNSDGLKDFYVLVTQADESVYLFLNMGNLRFDKKRLLSLPAHYGTTHFELLDFDADGDDDIVCSSGDSGDYGIILKPFHGVRLFENQGNHHFEQVWFHTQQGAYGTASADYDDDGDIDIASIGYFASHLDRGRESFIYFENQSVEKGEWIFEPHGIRGKKNECWILITSADVDNDGDLDIILGANSIPLSPENKALKSLEWQDRGGMVTILKNNLVE